MKILQVHKYLYRKAGAEAYLLDLAGFLVEHGHNVALWGTNVRPMIQDSRFMIHEDMLVDYLNFDRPENLVRDFRKFRHMLWSREAAGKFERVLKEFKPEVVHLHNIYHHISPSILPVAARHKVPVIMTVHDYHLINPNYTLYDHGEVCERKGARAIAHRCIKNSLLASFADVLEWSVHKWLRVYEKRVEKFLAPTEFVKQKLVEGGFDKDKIEVVPLMVAHNPTPTPLILRGGDDRDPPLKVRGGRGSYVLFSGRLTVEKGIYVLLEIAKRLPEIQFKIAGDGPELPRITKHVTRSTMKNVEFLGFVKREGLQKVIGGARLIVVPSLWYEPSPLSVLEAMAAGKTVVASRIGGIPELIEDGETGFLIRPISPMGPIGPIIDKIKKIYYDEKLLKRVGKAAAQYAKRVHSPEKHYEKIMEIYETTIDRADRTDKSDKSDFAA